MSFTVREEYHEEIVAGTKRRELRRASPRWMRFLERRPVVGVFLSGRRPVHRRRIPGVRYIGSAREALGRDPSDRGRLDLGEGGVVEFDLAEEVRMAREIEMGELISARVLAVLPQVGVPPGTLGIVRAASTGLHPWGAIAVEWDGPSPELDRLVDPRDPREAAGPYRESAFWRGPRFDGTEGLAVIV